MSVKKRPLVLLSILGGVSLWACSAPSVQPPTTQQPSINQSSANPSSSPGVSQNSGVVSSVPPIPKDSNIATQDSATFPSDETPDARDLTIGTYRLKAPVRRRFKEPIIDSADAIEIPIYEFSGGYDVDKDGAENRNVASKVKVEGFGEHEILVNIEDYPIMDNREDVMVITDKNTKSSTTFQTDQDLFNYTIKQTETGFTTQQIAGELRIETQPDGSWLINGEAASTAEAAAKILIKHPIVKNTSIQAIGLLLSSAKFAAKNKAANAKPPEYVDLPYAKIDKTILTDVGDLVDETQLADFLNQAFFQKQDLEDLNGEDVFTQPTNFGEISEAVPYEGEILYENNEGFDESELILNEVFEHEQELFKLRNANKSPIWGDFGTNTLTMVQCKSGDGVASNYGNPVPLLQAVFDLKKSERSVN